MSSAPNSSIQFDSGYLSPYFITDKDTLTAVLDNALVLLFDGPIYREADTLHLLELAQQAKHPLLVVAGCLDGEVLSTLVVNNVRGIVGTCAVKPPGFGDVRAARLQELAELTGGRVIPDTPGALASITLKDLGRAKRVSVDKYSTTIETF